MEIWYLLSLKIWLFIDAKHWLRQKKNKTTTPHLNFLVEWSDSGLKVMLGCGFITITPDCLQAFVIKSKDGEMEAEKQTVKAYLRSTPSKNLRCIIDI